MQAKNKSDNIIRKTAGKEKISLKLWMGKKLKLLQM